MDSITSREEETNQVNMMKLLVIILGSGTSIGTLPMERSLGKIDFF